MGVFGTAPRVVIGTVSRLAGFNLEEKEVIGYIPEGLLLCVYTRLRTGKFVRYGSTIQVQSSQFFVVVS